MTLLLGRKSLILLGSRLGRHGSKNTHDPKPMILLGDRSGTISAPYPAMSETAKSAPSAPLRDDLSFLFSLRVRLGGTTRLVVHAFENYGANYGGSHTRIDAEATLIREGGRRETLWPRGATWCGIPNGKSIDGEDAKELVLSLLAMKPGDTDEDYFAGWTQAQLDFASRYGEELSLTAMDRYGER
jgi:hypothetical protein